MEDLKAMARAKRASSKRGRARHSHHKHAHVAAVCTDPGAVAAARDQNAVADEVLPSNWERYSDGGGSDDEGAAPPVDGEVRPKSRGADYSELLSSDAPKLYEDLQELGGLSSMMLDPGLGLWNGDSWLEPPSASEMQTAHDAAALLSVDLRLLGKSIAHLHVAERLIVEMELFPKQEKVKHELETLEYPSRVSTSGTDNRLQEGKRDDPAKADTRVASKFRNYEHTTTSLRNNRGVATWNESGSAADAATTPRQSSFIESTDNISVIKGGAPLLSIDTVEQRTRENDRTTNETSAQPPGFRKFVPADAEADLDDLLDMLDNQAAQLPSDTNDLRNGPELAFSPDLSFLSKPSRGGPQFSKVDSPPREPSRIPVVVSGTHYMSPTVVNTDKSVQGKATSKEVKSGSALALDDDFDSWLDSI